MRLLACMKEDRYMQAHIHMFVVVCICVSMCVGVCMRRSEVEVRCFS